MGTRNVAGQLTRRWHEVNGRCELTGWELDINEFNIDHKIPISRGGTDECSNLQLLSPLVNTAKGTMTNDEFIGMCVAVAEYSGR